MGAKSEWKGVMDSRWPFGCVMLRGRPLPTLIYYSKRDLKCIPLRWISFDYLEVRPIFLFANFGQFYFVEKIHPPSWSMIFQQSVVFGQIHSNLIMAITPLRSYWMVMGYPRPECLMAPVIIGFVHHDKYLMVNSDYWFCSSLFKYLGLSQRMDSRWNTSAQKQTTREEPVSRTCKYWIVWKKRFIILKNDENVFIISLKLYILYFIIL